MDPNTSNYFQSMSSELGHSSKESSKFMDLMRPSTSNMNVGAKDIKGYVGPPKNIYQHNETIKDAKVDTKKQFYEKRNSLSRVKYLIGKVDHIVRWSKHLKEHDYVIIYQVVGLLENSISRENENLLFIRGDCGKVLQCVFYSIDRKLKYIATGSFIKVTGKMKGANKMQIFEVEPTTKDEYEEALPRLIFASQRVYNEIIKK